MKWLLIIFFSVFIYFGISIGSTHTQRNKKANKVSSNFAQRIVQGFNMRYAKQKIEH
jgi:hypothetical protein